MGRPKNVAGQRFGILTAVELVGKNKNNQSLWRCVCDCGKGTVVKTTDLLQGHTKSCGCLRGNVPSELWRENIKHAQTSNIKHGLSKTPLYKMWRNMKYRCYGEGSSAFKWYGARGIRVCDEWRNDFCAFRDWALSNGYVKEDATRNNKYTLDRIDVNGNYEPNNCRFVNMRQQSRNRLTNVLVDGMVLLDWCKTHGQSYSLVAQRRQRGWSLEEAVRTPKGGKRHHEILE